MATIVIPTTNRDLTNFSICLKSIRKFLVPKDFKLLVITPIEDMLKVEKIVREADIEALPISIKTDNEIIPDVDNYTVGWARIQILKLLCSTVVDTDFFLILNSTNILVKPLSIENIIQNNKGIIDYGEPHSSVQDAYNIFEEQCPNPNMPVMRMTPAVLSTYLTNDMLSYIHRKKGNYVEFLYNNVGSIPWYIFYFVYYKISSDQYNPHYSGKLWCQYNTKNPYNFLDWNVPDIFNQNSEGYFFITNLVWNVPSEIVLDLFQSRLECVQENPEPLPLISCVLVAKDVSDISSSISCYRKQTYINKELVVVHNGNLNEVKESLKNEPSIRFVDGNENIDTKGDYIINWDVNSWYHPSRISVQYSMKGGMNGSVVENVIVVERGNPYFTISGEVDEWVWKSTLLSRKAESDSSLYKITGINYSMLVIKYSEERNVGNQMKMLKSVTEAVRPFNKNSREEVNNVVQSIGLQGTGIPGNKELLRNLKARNMTITESDKENIQKVQILLLVGLNIYLLYKLVQSI